MTDVDWTTILEMIDDRVDQPMSQGEAKENLRALRDELDMRIDSLKDDEGEE